MKGARCLDAGASTGGFTDVLLREGASQVVAVDVGYGQLAWSLQSDDRVTVVDRTNIRHAEPDTIGGRVDVTVADLSFISLTLVLPAAVAVARDDADFVLLVKPQFEVGRTEVRGGVVSDPQLRARAVRGVLDAARPLGLFPRGVIASPVTGTHGNREYLVHLAHDADADPERILATVHWDDAPPRAGGATSDTMG